MKTGRQCFVGAVSTKRLVSHMEASGTVAGVTALLVASWAPPLSYRLLFLLCVGAASEPAHGCCSHRALLRGWEEAMLLTLSSP